MNKSKEMITAFIFDMDGVIIDSEPLQLHSFNHVLHKFDVAISMPEFKRNYMGYRDIQICKMIIADYNLPISTEEFVSKKRETYLDIHKQGDIKPIPGVIEAIKEIHEIMPIAIASSSIKPEIEVITEQLGIRELFSALVSTSELERGKPAPDVYLHTAKLLNAEPKNCGAIEDTRLGVQAAKSAGMYCIGITTTHNISELKDADTVIDSFDQLVQIIKDESSQRR